ncbi:MAG: HAMP domain-containing protein, partial [Acidobacteria bacterium]|nr:HAMP domain-containing protein [Acidobacteriota bacterium]
MDQRLRELMARPLGLLGGAPLSSLRGRLALATGATVAVIMSVSVWLSLTAARQVLAQEVVEVVIRTAERSADAVALVPDPITREAVTPIFSAILASAPTAQHVSLLVPRARTPRVLAQGGAGPTPAGLEMARRALASGRSEVLNDGQTVGAAVPVSRSGKLLGVIVVRGDLRSMMALQQRALRSVVVFAVLAGVGLVLLVDLAARSIVYRPIEHLRRTIASAAAGDLSARVKVTRRDELGQVARGLNEMLAQIEQFNQTLQSRVRQAMGAVETQNEQLMKSYRRMFLLREELANAEHLAAVGQTAANVAHEVGTPLNLISGYVQLAKEDVPRDSPLAGRLAIIEEQIAKVTTAVRALLNRSRHTGTRARTSALALIDQVSDAIRPNL